MASRYDDFGVFMADVTERTKHKVQTSYGDVWLYLRKILKDFGWVGFAALCAILVLGPIAFGIAVLTFVLTPIGIALAVLCAGGAGAALWTIYRQRKLPLAIKKVGENYKARYDASESKKEIDCLLGQASNDLFKELVM